MFFFFFCILLRLAKDFEYVSYQVYSLSPFVLQAGSLRVHGVAMPTMKGIVNVLNHIGAQKKGKQTRVLWHSLREEPVR